MLDQGMTPDQIMQQLQQMGLPPEALQQAQQILQQLTSGGGGAPPAGGGAPMPEQGGAAPAAPAGGGGKGGGGQAVMQEVLARVSSLEGSMSMLVELIKSLAPAAAGAASAAAAGPSPMPGGIDPSAMDAGMPLVPKMASSSDNVRTELVRGLILDLLGK